MGFAAGFQAGSQVVERALQRQKEEELQKNLAEAYKAPSSGFGYTSEDMARMRQMQGAGEGAYNIEAVPGSEGGTPTLRYTPTGLNLGSGDMPEAPTNFAPQQIQRYGDQAVAGQFSPAQLRGLQAQAAARAVGASGDYRGAALLQQQAEEAEFNAKYRPLQLQSMQGQLAGQAQQQALTGLQLKGAQRTEEKTVSFDAGLADIYKQKFEKPEDRTTAILSLVEQTQGPKARMELESSYTSSELNKMNLDAAKFQKGFQTSFTKGVDATMAWLDEQNPGFTLERKGNQIIQTNTDGTKRTFAQGNENAIMEQFAGMASPANFLTLAKNIADRQKTEELLKIERDKAQTTKNYYESKTGLDRMGAATYFTGTDGNTYATIPTMGKNGLTTETIKINPDNIKFQKPGTEGKGTDMKPGKVAEEGEKATIAGQLRIADGLGNWVPAGPNGKPLGVLPSDRTKFLEKANIPTNMIPQIPWNTNGTEVMFGGKAYEVNNPADIKELKADYKRLGANTIAVEEEQRNIPGRNTGLFAVGQPYDPYGASQRPRMGATQAEVDAFNAQKALQARNRAIAQRQTDLYNAQQLGLE
jgi:hypothetical protein